MLPASVNNNPAHPPVIPPLHHVAANGTVAVPPLARPGLRAAATRGRAGQFAGQSSKFLFPHGLICRPIGQCAEGGGVQPQPGTTGTLQQPIRSLGRRSADQPRGLVFPAIGAGQRGDLAGRQLGLDPHPAVVTMFGATTDPRQAFRTDGIQIPFVQGEICSAKRAGDRGSLAGGAAGRAAYDRRLMIVRLPHLDHLAAMAMKAAAHFQVTGIVLPFALAAGHKQLHGTLPAG